MITRNKGDPKNNFTEELENCNSFSTFVIVNLYFFNLNKNLLMNFSTKQKIAIEAGKIRRSSLVQAAAKFAKADISSNYPHSYIYSLGGLGKTYTVKKAVEQAKVPHSVITGNATAWGFALDLAIINYQRKKGVPYCIIVDDCDTLLNDNFINTLKNMLEGEKVLNWTKNLNQSLFDTEIKAEAYEYHRKEVGFAVPCDEFVFIFTSNRKLPTFSEAQAAQAKGPTAGNSRTINLNAIRTRCNTKDIIFSEENMEHWGWLADVVLNEGSVDNTINKNQQVELLNFLWNNWDRLSDKDLRTVDKMAQIMANDDEYLDTWENDYIDYSKKRK
jgi:hypothetical protein